MALATHPTWRFRVTDLDLLRRSGVLPEDVRVELLDGEVAPMSPSGSEHGSVTNRLHELLTKIVGDEAMVWGQSAVVLSPHTLVLPDVALLRPRPDFYFDAPPTPGDLLLVVEVSHSSLARDREVKSPLYARARVPELWIVHVESRRVEVLRDPRGGRFRSRDEVGLGGRLTIAALEGLALPVRAFLPET